MERYRTLKKKSMSSGEVAKLRLEQTLASDFLECSPEQLETMQKEILEILSRYLNMNDMQKISLNVTQEIKQGVHYVKTIQLKGL